jgi:hypothetical protein
MLPNSIEEYADRASTHYSWQAGSVWYGRPACQLAIFGQQIARHGAQLRVPACQLPAYRHGSSRRASLEAFGRGPSASAPTRQWKLIGTGIAVAPSLLSRDVTRTPWLIPDMNKTDFRSQKPKSRGWQSVGS